MSQHAAPLAKAQPLFYFCKTEIARGQYSLTYCRAKPRNRGIGAALMRALEDHARALGRTLLALDTTHNMPAERLYLRCGWTRFGIMPGHALMPDGTLSDTSFFYKQLISSPQ